MSEIDKMLNNISDGDIALYLANDAESEEHIVIDDDRKIIVPDSLKRIAVQHDHDIETVTFDCPRYWDGHDLSKMMVYVNHLCPNGSLGCTVATNVTVDSTNSDIMHFDWTISDCVTMAEGYITFLVCAKTQDEDGTNRHHWNSEICRDMYVSEGLELPDDFMETYPDVLTQVLLFNQNVLELQKTTMQRSAVYVGSGEVPDGYNVQIDPNGDNVNGEGAMELIVSGTVEENGSLTINKDANNNTFSLKSAILRLIGQVSGSSGQYMCINLGAYYAEVQCNPNTDYYIVAEAIHGTVPMLRVITGTTIWQTPINKEYLITRRTSAANNEPFIDLTMDSVKVQNYQGNNMPAAGMTYELWGIRA